MGKLIKKDELDRFYTTPEVVDLCLNKLPDLSGYVVVEPSAGGGAFSSRFPGCIAVDLSPAAPGVIQADFLTWVPPVGRVAVVGNPPYGVGGALITSFIKKACSFADLVAFVLPLSYAKPSMHARWPKNFHLTQELVLPSPNATLHGELVQTRNVWQVWKRRKEVRKRPEKISAVGWEKVKWEQGDVAMRTVGTRGQLNDLQVANPTAHIAIRFGRPVDRAALEAHLLSWKWSPYNMGQPSAGWGDYAPALNAFFESEQEKAS